MSKHLSKWRWVAAIALLAMFVDIYPSSAQSQDTLPDLVVTGIAFSPEFPEANQIVEVRVEVQNIGRGAAQESRLILRVNEQIWASQSLPPLTPQHSTVLTFAWVAGKGKQTLEAHANAFGDIGESNIRNNKLDRVVEFTPDLIIEAVALSPQNPKPGALADVSITVRNVGGQRTAENATVHFKLGRSIIKTFSIRPLGAGERVELSARWLPVMGEHVVRFAVDPLEMISESDELNNAVSGVINISSNPPTGANLVVEALEASPSRPRPGEQVTLSAHIRNNGHGPSEAFQVMFEIDGHLFTSSWGRALLPGETIIVSTNWTAIAGERVLRVKADHQGVIVEVNESDNVNSILIHVGGAVNDCTQSVYLELETDAVPLMADALGLSDEAVMSVFLPKIKSFMERDFKAVNLSFTLNPPRGVHSRVRLLAESRFAILGSAPLDVDNRNRGDVGSVFLGSFMGLGGRALQRFNIDQIAQAVANTASHELGHLLGLEHNKVNDLADAALNLMSATNEATSFFEDAFFSEENLEYLRDIVPFECQS